MNDDTLGAVAATSPLAIYRSHLAAGRLAYQHDSETGKTVFYPRMIGPVTGNPALEWRLSAGLGTVYACTVIAPRGEPAYNVVLVDMDEGFRLMSRVETDDALAHDAVRIGLRVQVRIVQPDSEAPYPVFDPFERSDVSAEGTSA